MLSNSKCKRQIYPTAHELTPTGAHSVDNEFLFIWYKQIKDTQQINRTTISNDDKAKKVYYDL